MDGPWIESLPVGGGRCKIIRARPDRPWGPYSLLHHGYQVFHGAQSGRGVALTTNTHPALRLKKEYSNNSTTPPAFAAFFRVNFNYFCCYFKLRRRILRDMTTWHLVGAAHISKERRPPQKGTMEFGRPVPRLTTHLLPRLKLSGAETPLTVNAFMPCKRAALRFHLTNSLLLGSLNHDGTRRDGR